MKLYGYWRSTASYRVRIALNLKSIDVEHIAVDLKNGEQNEGAYAQINPQSLVPALELENGAVLTQSLAIIDYLEEVNPTPPLLPDGPDGRARVRAFAQAITADTHPIQNLRVLTYLRQKLGQDAAAVNNWAAHWIECGLKPLEKVASERKTRFLFGNAPGYAECALIPQLYNARRFAVDLTHLPRLCQVEARCVSLATFQNAHPDRYAPKPLV